MERKELTAETEAELPLHLLFHEILHWLPVKSLLRFMSVSKVWSSFLKTPEFARMHLSRLNLNSDTNQQKLLLMSYSRLQNVFHTIDHEDRSVGVVHHNFPREYAKQMLPLCSCNGMVCLAIGHRHPCKASYLDLVLWNPSMRYYKKFQSITRFGIDYHKHAWGLYYEEGVNDYKIVEVNSKGGAYIFSVKSNSWRTIKGVDGACCYSSAGVMVNGHLYWTARNGHDYLNLVLISFDLKNEKFVKMPLATMGNNRCCSTRLATHQGRLHLFICYASCKEIELWRINVNKKEVWEKIVTLVFRLRSDPICFTSNGKVVMIQWESKNLVLYDPVDCTTQHYLQTGCDAWIVGTGITYNETLVSPNEIG